MSCSGCRKYAITVGCPVHDPGGRFSAPDVDARKQRASTRATTRSRAADTARRRRKHGRR